MFRAHTSVWFEDGTICCIVRADGTSVDVQTIGTGSMHDVRRVPIRHGSIRLYGVDLTPWDFE